MPEIPPLASFSSRCGSLPDLSLGLVELARTKGGEMAKRVHLGSHTLKKLADQIVKQMASGGGALSRRRAEVPGGSDAVASAFLSRFGVCLCSLLLLFSS